MTIGNMDSETAEEIRRHFNVVGESLRTEIRAVAEGLMGLRETTSAELKAVRDEIADTRAMLRLFFAFADLERHSFLIVGQVGPAPPGHARYPEERSAASGPESRSDEGGIPCVIAGYASRQGILRCAQDDGVG